MFYEYIGFFPSHCWYVHWKIGETRKKQFCTGYYYIMYFICRYGLIITKKDGNSKKPSLPHRASVFGDDSDDDGVCMRHTFDFILYNETELILQSVNHQVTKLGKCCLYILVYVLECIIILMLP